MTDTVTEYVPKKGDTVLIQELAKGTAKGPAAVKAGVHRNTISARMQDPVFRKLVSEHRAAFLDQVAGVLSSAAVGAALKLEEMYQDDDRPDHVQQNAARTVLEFTIRITELYELADRITELEDLIKDVVDDGT